MPKNFVEQPFRVSLNSGIGKIYASEGYVTISVEIICLTLPKIFVEETSVLCFKKFPVAKKFMDKRGEYQDFPPEVFCLSAEKRRRVTL